MSALLLTVAVMAWVAIGVGGVLWFFSAEIDVDTTALGIAIVLGGPLGPLARLLVLGEALGPRPRSEQRVWIRRRG